jgi:CheY-like chemotaxis protein
LGVGSIFSICLPYQVFNGDKSIVKVSENQINSSYNELKGVKVLLAEDNPVNQMVTIDLLKNKGAEVDLAENGKIALEKVVLGSYDVVLMDMQMPIMDGYSAMREIRLDSKYKNLPILALTAHVSAQEESNCIKNGANDYLSKPFKPSELFAKIQLLVPKKDQNEIGDSTINSNQEISMNKDNLSDNVCDFSMLYKFTNKNKSIVKSTLKLLMTIIPKDIKELREHLSLRDFKRIKAIAHRSKPNFKLILTEGYASIIVSIEELAEDSENYNQIAKIISDLEQKESYILSAIEHELSLL